MRGDRDAMLFLQLAVVLTCFIKGHHADDFILVTDSSKQNIYRMDLSTFAQTEILHDNHRQPNAIGYDHVSQNVYWSDVSSNHLETSKLDGSNFEILANLRSYARPDGLAIDPISRNLFVTDAGTKSISVTNLESFELITIATRLDEPRGIALHPFRGYIFWTDKGTHTIERAHMDGTNRVHLITSGLVWPNGIAIDFSDDKIYWIDAFTNTMEGADFDGQNRVTIYTGTGHMFGLVLIDDYIYYTDWSESSVMRINKNGADNMRVGPATFGKLNEITAYTSGEGIYSDFSNVCSQNRGGCSHICVPIPDGAIATDGAIASDGAVACLCPDNAALGEDGKTCVRTDLITDIRLVDGTNSLNGRLEVKYDGHWGTVCDDYFDSKDASVACAQLGHPNPVAVAWGGAFFGEGPGRINLANVNCAGTETFLHDCESTHYPNHKCKHYEDVGVDCDFSPDSSEVLVRLVGGSAENEGRVEVVYRDMVGTICRNNWDEKDAQVICFMLGYQRAGSQIANKGIFGEGEGRIWVDDINCAGSEDLITGCQTTKGWNSHTCSHEDDAGVICFTGNGCTENNGGCSHTCVPLPEFAIECLCPDKMTIDEEGKTCIGHLITGIRLVDGTNALNGRLEVQHNRQWGTVCGSYFSDKDARVACAQLHHPNDAAIVLPATFFGEGTGLINFGRVRFHCTGTETSLSYCESSIYHSVSCEYSSDVGVECDLSPDSSNMFVRLVGYTGSVGGRVDLIYGDMVGTICGHNWGENDAKVICSMLGYHGSGSRANSGSFNEPYGRIWVDWVNCAGNEDVITDCPTSNGWNTHTCSHKDDAGVICSTDQPPDNFILVTDSRSKDIFRMDLTTFAHIKIPYNHRYPRGIGYDPNNQKLYWSDLWADNINSANLDGANVDIIKRFSSSMNPTGVAIDPISRNLFLGSGGDDTISVTNLESIKLIPIITTNSPISIALHPAKGYIFWTDRAAGSRISRANMDGTGRLALVPGEGSPYGIAIDYKYDKIYWAEASTDAIMKADFDGQNSVTLFRWTGNMYGLALVGDYIYTTGKSSVMRIDKTGENNMTVGPPIFGSLKDMIAYTSGEGIYTLAKNGCSVNRGGCSHTCVPLPNEAIKCLCQCSRQLDADGKTCIRG